MASIARHSQVRLLLAVSSSMAGSAVRTSSSSCRALSMLIARPAAQPRAILSCTGISSRRSCSWRCQSSRIRKSPYSTISMAQWAIQARALSLSPLARAVRTASVHSCCPANQRAALSRVPASSVAGRRRRRCSRNSGWKLNQCARSSRAARNSCRRSRSPISAWPLGDPVSSSASRALNLSTVASRGN
ncbi:hypothetical protein D9M71_616800 [compost metagenome]